MSSRVVVSSNEDTTWKLTGSVFHHRSSEFQNILTTFSCRETKVHQTRARNDTSESCVNTS